MSKPLLEGYTKLPMILHTGEDGEYGTIPVRASYVHNGRRFIVKLLISPELEQDSMVPLEDILMREAERFLQSEGIIV